MRLGERRKFKSSSHLYSRAVTINVLRLCWIVLLVWGEVGSFFWSLSSCKWPDSEYKPTRILLVSDPQVQLPSTLRQRPTWLNIVHHFVFELNLKKSWRVTTRLRPHIVIFLGDMLANGKSVKNELEYQQYVQKFKSIFTLDPSTKTHYIPGNNDVGMGVSSSLSHVRSSYVGAFGSPNKLIVIRNHTFVLLDAPGLVDEDYQRSGQGVTFEKWKAIPEGTVSFVKSIKRDENPLILLSHIPLSRPDTASCGTLRERGSIRQGVGNGYQNTLGKHTTNFLLGLLRPSAIYSGDNRDYCEYTHVSRGKAQTDTYATGPREVTVKSFSLAKHIHRPGFQLLSLSDPAKNILGSPRWSFVDTPCHLPDQYGIYFSTYGLFFAFNVFVLVLLSMSRARKFHGRIPDIEPLTISPHSSGNNTPSLDPESAIWSPYTPANPNSPRNALPLHIRTPNTLTGPTFRVSKPATPLGSPLLSPMIYSLEEDESMYPLQYTSRKDGRLHEQEDNWSPGHDRLSSDPQIPRFTSAPRAQHIIKPPVAWSWTFVLRGRRRRISIAVPSAPYKRFFGFGALLFWRGSQDMALTRRRILYYSFLDGFLVLWPPILIWALFAWWMF